MKILVTGAAGFIGHNVVRFLEQQGHECFGIDSRTDYGFIPKAELDYLIKERCKRIQALPHVIDIREAEKIKQFVGLFNIQTVVHLASFPRQKVVNANPAQGSRVMSEGLLNLLEASVSNNVKKFVYVSSSMVYGNFKDTYFDGVDESHPTDPIGQYGIMKLAGEWLVKDYSRRTGMLHTIIRPSAVYGPLDVEDRVVSKFLLTAMRGGEIQVNGGNEQLDFTFVDDATQGIVRASTSDNTNNTTYNITRGQSHTLLEAAELAVQIAGQGTIKVNPTDNTFPSRGQLNITRACQDFGYAPTTNIEQGFREYHDWLKNSIYWN